MTENHKLRGLIRNLSEFIGEGIGSCLPKLGFDKPEVFYEFINRSETDTAAEGYKRRKQDSMMARGSSDAGPSGALGAKRTLEDDDDSRAKRAKTNGTMSADSMPATHERYDPIVVPVAPTAVTNSYYASASRTPGDARFENLLHSSL